jgi:hypothetical protein
VPDPLSYVRTQSFLHNTLRVPPATAVRSAKCSNNSLTRSRSPILTASWFRKDERIIEGIYKCWLIGFQLTDLPVMRMRPSHKGYITSMGAHCATSIARHRHVRPPPHRVATKSTDQALMLYAAHVLTSGSAAPDPFVATPAIISQSFCSLIVIELHLWRAVVQSNVVVTAVVTAVEI